MTIQERSTLDSALLALGKSAGIASQIDPIPDHASNALVEIKTDRRQFRFCAQVKTADRFETPAMLMAHGKPRREPPLLVAPYITREVAERCRQLGLPFIDTAGNAYLEAPGLFVYVVGRGRPAELRRGSYHALNPAGLKLTFALLCRPKLLDESYRTIATHARVGLGTVSSDMKDLENRGFFNLKIHPSVRKLLDPGRMLEEWVTHYPITLLSLIHI